MGVGFYRNQHDKAAFRCSFAATQIRALCLQRLPVLPQLRCTDGSGGNTMKITFDIPETTVAVIMSFVYPDNDTNMMNLVSKTVGTDELKDRKRAGVSWRGRP